MNVAAIVICPVYQGCDWVSRDRSGLPLSHFTWTSGTGLIDELRPTSSGNGIVLMTPPEEPPEKNEDDPTYPSDEDFEQEEE